MRRLIVLPLLLCVSSVVVALPGTRLGRAADRLALGIAQWASAAEHAA